LSGLLSRDLTVENEYPWSYFASTLSITKEIKYVYSNLIIVSNLSQESSTPHSTAFCTRIATQISFLFSYKPLAYNPIISKTEPAKRIEPATNNKQVKIVTVKYNGAMKINPTIIDSIFSFFVIVKTSRWIG
jgi:hypothetical protein